MILKLLIPVYKVRIALLHATYHRMIKHAERARMNHDVLTFKKYIYKSEDAWRKLVILTHKIKPNG